MAKKAPAPKAQAADSTKQLVDAIITVKRLQDFIHEHGNLERAVEAVARVQGLIDLTGGFGPLKQALEIIGRESAAPQA
jgi:hypothetical protein